MKSAILEDVIDKGPSRTSPARLFHRANGGLNVYRVSTKDHMVGDCSGGNYRATEGLRRQIFEGGIGLRATNCPLKKDRKEEKGEAKKSGKGTVYNLSLIHI